MYLTSYQMMNVYSYFFLKVNYAFFCLLFFSMLAAGDTAKKVILKVRELINNKELFAFLLLVRVLLYVLIIMITRMPQSLLLIVQGL